MSIIRDKFLDETIETTKMLSLHKRVAAFDIVGSARYVEYPKDLDFLVLIDGTSFMQEGRWAFGSDWNLCAGEYDDQDDQWGAIRKDKVNLIVTVDKGWYERMKLASEVCAALKLQDKGDRIVVHRVVRDGYDADSANARRDGSR